MGTYVHIIHSKVYSTYVTYDYEKALKFNFKLHLFTT
jgi:hypothetical protein